MGLWLAYLVFTGEEGKRILLTALAVGVCALPWGRWVWPRAAKARRHEGTKGRSPEGRNPKGRSSEGGMGGSKRWVGAVVVGMVALGAVGGLAIKRGIPLPYVHDEFSYLLAGDTFAHGRVTNPAHPMWEHFETMHVLVRPTYMSKYPPGQGLFLALGQVVTGRPIVGVWICTALACVAIWWMLRGLVPPGWALLGGVMAAMHPQMLEWGQRYWGGTVGVLGGALAVGGFVRVVWGEEATKRQSDRATEGRSPKGHSPTGRSLQGHSLQGRVVGIRVGDGVAMAGGIVLMGLSRPFEGLVLAVLLGAGLVWWMMRSASWGEVWRVVWPMLVVLVPAAGWMGYYNWRITGHALRLPYQEHHAQYGVVPVFIFQQKSAKPVYRHKEIEIFQVREQEYWYKRRGSWYELKKEAYKNVDRLTAGWLGNVEVLALPLMVLPWVAWKDRRVRWLAGMLALLTAVLMLETYMFPHYASPAAGLVVAIVVMAMWHLSRMGQPVGALLVRITVVVFLLWAGFWWKGFYVWKQEGFAAYRNQVATKLAQEAGQQLVIVRYGEHNVHEEWVYNEADIDAAKVVWAREMDEARNRRLLEYFADRKVWLLEPDVNPTEIKAYLPRSK